MFAVPDHQAAGHYTRAEDHHRGKNDFPLVHQMTSAAESWSATASKVFSKSCE
jgi:hypothetical protein